MKEFLTNRDTGDETDYDPHQTLSEARRQAFKVLLGDSEFCGRIDIARRVMAQRDELPDHIVDYHRHFLTSWGLWNEETPR